MSTSSHRKSHRQLWTSSFAWQLFPYIKTNSTVNRKSKEIVRKRRTALSISIKRTLSIAAWVLFLWKLINIIELWLDVYVSFRIVVYSLIVYSFVVYTFEYYTRVVLGTNSLFGWAFCAFLFDLLLSPFDYGH